MSPGNDEKEIREPVFGVDPESEEMLSGLLGEITTDTDELSMGGLNDIDVCIVGFSYKQGGEMIKIKRGPRTGEEFPSSDQITLELRIDRCDADLKSPYTQEFLALPSTSVGADGVTRRPEPTQNSKYGLFLAALKDLGVSSNQDYAEQYLIRKELNVWDLYGLQYKREAIDVENFDGSTYRAYVPTAILGFDNGVRTEQGTMSNDLWKKLKGLGLGEAHLIGQEAAAAGG